MTCGSLDLMTSYFSGKQSQLNKLRAVPLEFRPLAFSDCLVSCKAETDRPLVSLAPPIRGSGTSIKKRENQFIK